MISIQALVHHGSISRNTNYAYEESKLTTDNVINAIVNLNMTNEERAATRISRFHDNDKVGRRVVNNKKVYEEKLNPGSIDERDQPFHHIFSILDIATETTVVGKI